MLPGNTGRRNAGPRRGTATPARTRNISPREPVVLPDEDEARGGDFYDCELEYHRPARSALSVFLDEDDDDGEDPSEAVARARAKREQARIAETDARAEREVAPAVAVGPGTDVPDEDTAGPPVQADVAADAGDHTAPSGESPAEPILLTPDEIRRRARRDRLVVKRMREADRGRLRGITGPDALAGESTYMVVCYGAGLRLAVEAKADAHAELYYAPRDDTREARQARLSEAAAVVARGRRKIAAYEAWVAKNRPELADDELLEMLAGPKEDRAAAKARLAGLDKKYRTGTGKSGPTAPDAALAGEAAVPLPLVYQAEFQGKVRAYPEWVARVLRKVAEKRNHSIPAMALVLAQLAYWAQPADGTGRPRAKRARVIAGRWWVVLGYGQIEKQTPVSKGQARRAVEHLKALKLVETLTPEDAGVGSEAGGVDYGPNTVFLRINTAVLDPLVREVMSGESKSGFEK
jgi:hypothetical protein